MHAVFLFSCSFSNELETKCVLQEISRYIFSKFSLIFIQYVHGFLLPAASADSRKYNISQVDFDQRLEPF